MTYYVQRLDEPLDRVTFALVVGVGNARERPDERQFAHLCEHLVVSQRKSGLGDMVALREQGLVWGRDVLANTGANETTFSIKLKEDDGAIERGLSLLDRLSNPDPFEPADVEREKGAIYSEGLTGSTPGKRRIESAIQFQLSGKSGDATGEQSRKELAAIDPDRINAFRAQWYVPDNIALVIIGNVDPADISSRIENRYGKTDAPLTARYPLIDKPRTATRDDRFALVSDPEAESSFSIERIVRGNFRDEETWVTAALTREIVNQRILKLSRRYMPAFRSATLAIETERTGEARIALQASLNPSRLRTGVTTLTAILSSRTAPISARELEVARARLRGDRSFLATDSVTGTLRGIIDNFLYGEPVLAPAVVNAKRLELLETVDLDAVRRVAADWSAGFADYVMTTTPGLSVPTRDAFREWTSEGKKMRLAIAAEGSDRGPIPDLEPQARPFSGLQLHNDPAGVFDVLVDPGSRFRLFVGTPAEAHNENRFVLAGFVAVSADALPKGMSVEDVVSLMKNAGGAGLDRFELEDWLAARRAKLNYFVRDGLPSFSLEGEIADFDLLARTLASILGNPSVSNVAFADWQERRAARSDGVEKSDPSLLSRWIAKGSADPSVAGPSIFTPREYERAFRAIFAPRNDYSIAVRGSLPQGMLLAGLSSFNVGIQSSSRPSTGLRKPDLSVRFHEAELGVSGGATVQLNVHLKPGIPFAQLPAGQVVASLLSDRMLARLRVKEGGVYSVWVGFDADEFDPVLTICFATADANARSLALAAIDELHRLVDAPPITSAEFDKARRELPGGQSRGSWEQVLRIAGAWSISGAGDFGPWLDGARGEPSAAYATSILREVSKAEDIDVYILRPKR